MAGVVAPVITRHKIRPRGQIIHDASLALVPPLGANDDIQ